MARSGLEELKTAETAYVEAGNGLESSHSSFQQAQTAEVVAGERSEELYRALFRDGFVIKRVIDPNSVHYFAGVTEGNIFNPEDDGDSVHLSLDTTHAAGLAGMLAIGVRPRLSGAGRSEEALRLGEPQASMTISFEVPGIHNNEEDLFEHETWMGENTEYGASLRAIEWRLLTGEEIEQYAEILTNGAARAARTRASLAKAA